MILAVYLFSEVPEKYREDYLLKRGDAPIILFLPDSLAQTTIKRYTPAIPLMLQDVAKRGPLYIHEDTGISRIGLTQDGRWMIQVD